MMINSDLARHLVSATSEGQDRSRLSRLGLAADNIDKYGTQTMRALCGIGAWGGYLRGLKAC